MNRKGQTLVEFVLILPLFIIILFVIIDFGLIISKKSYLDNMSVDIISMIKNGSSKEEIEVLYPDLIIDISKKDNYQDVKIEYDMKTITPGLNLILGDPYRITIERIIPDVKTE